MHGHAIQRLPERQSNSRDFRPNDLWCLSQGHFSSSTGIDSLPVRFAVVCGHPSIDHARLSAEVRHALPDAVTTFRSDVLSALTGGPLQHGAFTLFSLALVVAAILGLAVMLPSSRSVPRNGKRRSLASRPYEQGEDAASVVTYAS
jgi:hypothetical protein